MQRNERIADRHRRLYIDIAGYMLAHNGASIDALALAPILAGYHGESLSAALDSRRACRHKPFFNAEDSRELVTALCAASLSVIEGEIGRRVSTELLESAARAMGTHRQPRRERSRRAARRDVVRTAICVAVLDAANGTLNALFAHRISESGRAP